LNRAHEGEAKKVKKSRELEGKKSRTTQKERIFFTTSSLREKKVKKLKSFHLKGGEN